MGKSVLNTKPARPQLGNLPDHVLEQVLRALPLAQVAELRAVSRRFRSACNWVLRGAGLRLRARLDRALRAQRLRVEGAAYVSLALLRSLHALQMAQTELQQLLALRRGVLMGQRPLPAAVCHLLDGFHGLVDQAEALCVPEGCAQQVAALAGRLRECVGVEEEGAGAEMRPPLGVRVLDLLDALLGATCYQEERWNGDQVEVRARYEVREPLFLCLPPDVRALQTGAFVSPQEAARLVRWLALLVRYNNRLRLREAQWQSERRAAAGQGRCSGPAPPPRPQHLLAEDVFGMTELCVDAQVHCALGEAPLRLMERETQPNAAAPTGASALRPPQTAPMKPLGAPMAAASTSSCYWAHVYIRLVLPAPGGAYEHYSFSFLDSHPTTHAHFKQN